MIWTKFKALFMGPRSAKAGSFPQQTERLTECYAKIDTVNRWQGDVYPRGAFPQGQLPTQDVPYWMLLNRTCQLYEGAGRTPKLPYLNYVAVYTLESFLSFNRDSRSLRNQILETVRRNEQVIFLPADPKVRISRPLVANLNLIYTFSADRMPRAAEKVIQLASPFCEHVFQKLSRFFYTVGFDDAHIKSDEYVSKLVEDVKHLTEDKQP